MEMTSKAHYDDHSIFIPFFFSLYVSMLIAVMHVQFQVNCINCYLQSTWGKFRQSIYSFDAGFGVQIVGVIFQPSQRLGSRYDISEMRIGNFFKLDF